MLGSRKVTPLQFVRDSDFDSCWEFNLDNVTKNMHASLASKIKKKKFIIVIIKIIERKPYLGLKR